MKVSIVRISLERLAVKICSQKVLQKKAKAADPDRQNRVVTEQITNLVSNIHHADRRKLDTTLSIVNRRRKLKLVEETP